MGLLDGFEKLINEHGSAAILKERIALANDKYAAQEQKLADSQLRTKELDSDNQRLRSDLKRALIEIEDLKKTSVQSHSSRLDEIKEKILLLLSKREETQEHAIIQHLGVNEQLAFFHLEELESKDFVWAARVLSMMGSSPPTMYSLKQEGRRYLVTHGLLA